MRILVVEDEVKVAEALREGLTGERHDVVVELSGESGYFRSTTESFDIILLDLGLPGRDGLEVLNAIRLKKPEVPVIVVTARDGVNDRVSALDAGADDFIVKPFAFAELLARIRAVSRRNSFVASPTATVGYISLDRVTRVVTRHGQPVPLTVREFELLEYLMRYEGTPVPREAIVRDVWCERGRTPSLDNVIDVHVVRLRRKIDSAEAPRLLHTVRGIGFMMRDGEPR